MTIKPWKFYMWLAYIYLHTNICRNIHLLYFFFTPMFENTHFYDYLISTSPVSLKLHEGRDCIYIYLFRVAIQLTGMQSM